MDIARLQEATNIDALATYVGVRTQAGRSALLEKTGQWSSDLHKLQQKSAEFAILQSYSKTNSAFAKDLQAQFSELQELEVQLEGLTTKASDLETEAFNELLFLKDWSKPLNSVPFVLFLWSLLRVYIFPGMSLLMPLAMLVLPFIIIRFIFKLPLTLGHYTALLSALASGQITSVFTMKAPAEPAAASPIDIMQLLKTSLLLGTVVQSFLQPYWSFLHLSSIDAIIQKKADSLLQFQTLYSSIQRTLKGSGFRLSANPFAPGIEDPRQLVAEAQLHPTYLRLALKKLGSVEALFCLAQSDLTPVHWLTSSKPRLVVHDAFEYRVDACIGFTVDLGSAQSHALLTGPNRGGKSTTLRSILSSCLLAHTYGCAFAREAAMTPFKTLYACLTAEDLPGKKSRFEREIEFTAATLHPPPGHSLVLLDELYHSTNPPDAALACVHYTSQLWKAEQTLSVISTHLFDFVEQAPTSVQRLCCPATVREDQSIAYTYQLKEGVCRVSSVNELLVENGLLGCASSSIRQSEWKNGLRTSE